MVIRRDSRVVADFQHLKQSGTWTGWIKYDGETRPIDGYSGGRDRTFGVRVADQIDFWIWCSAELPDRAIEAYLVENHDETVQYIDGGFTYENGDLSTGRFVRLDHDITFDGNRKRPLSARLNFLDDEGERHDVAFEALHPEVGVYYGQSSLPLKQDGAVSWGAGTPRTPTSLPRWRRVRWDSTSSCVTNSMVNRGSASSNFTPLASRTRVTPAWRTTAIH